MSSRTTSWCSWQSTYRGLGQTESPPPEARPRYSHEHLFAHYIGGAYCGWRSIPGYLQPILPDRSSCAWCHTLAPSLIFYWQRPLTGSAQNDPTPSTFMHLIRTSATPPALTITLQSIVFASESRDWRSVRLRPCQPTLLHHIHVKT